MTRPRAALRRLASLRQRVAELPAAPLTAAGLGRCVGCDFAPFETVEEAARELGLDPKQVARRLAASARKVGRR